VPEVNFHLAPAMHDFIPPESMDEPAVALGSSVTASVFESRINARVPSSTVDLDDDPFGRSREVDDASNSVEPGWSELNLQKWQAGAGIPLQECALQDRQVDIAAHKKRVEHLSPSLDTGTPSPSQ
jgi:hypothetical protein